MSTSSSSDCECDDYCHYATGFYENYGNTVNRTPYYPTMGHPLVYYTQTNPYYQTQSVNRRQRRKGDPNCFVKAFRWYTQEHVPNKNDSRPQQNEFASWLDMKYGEFLGNKPDQQNNYKLTIKQTSVIQTEKIVQNVCADACSKNLKTKFKRLKSPWRRKCRARGYNEPGDVAKDNQSCHYILQPKELSRPNSECCQSSIITVSTEFSKKTTGKSQSLTNMCQNRSKNEPVEVKPTQEGVHLKKDSMQRNNSSMNKKSVPRTKSDFVNVSCQCTIGTISKIDVETQYEASTLICKGVASPSISKQVLPIKSSQPLKVVRQATPPTTRTVSSECGRNNIICECVNMEPVKKKSSVHAATQYEPQGNQGICNSALCPAVQVPKPPPRKCPCEIELEEFIVQAPLKLSDIGAQTSDRCITFEKGSPYNYPLFMKIICADKLIEENSK